MTAPAPARTKILPATPEHLPGIAGLAAVIWRAHYPGIISREQIDYMLSRMYSLPTMQQEIQSLGVSYVRLLVDDAFVGFASYGLTEDRRIAKLHKLYMLPDFHGQGLGSRMLQHCIHAARSLGASRLILAVNKRNTKAITAYQRAGFAIVQSVVTDFGSGFVMDDFIMAKELVP